MNNTILVFPFLKGLPFPLPFPLLRTCNREFHLEFVCDALSLDELLSRIMLYPTTPRGSGANGFEVSIGGFGGMGIGHVYLRTLR